MSGSVNKIVLIGNLGQDPETKNIANGSKMCSFSMATHEKWRDREGNRHEKVQWHRVVIWNENLINIASNYLRKGSKVYIEGQMEYRKFTDSSGNEKTIAEVVIPRFRGELMMLDSNAFDNGRNQEDAPRKEERYDRNNSGINRVLGPNYKNAPIDDDQIPF